jgi:hypothetical protein
MEFVDDLPARSRKSRGPSAYVAEAAELREHPGQWAILRTLPKVNHASQLACGIRTGRLAAFRPAGSYEATVLTRPERAVHVPRESAVYVRYVGITERGQAGVV